VAVDDIGAKTSELADTPHKCLRKRRLSQNQNRNAFSDKLFSESAKIAVSDHRDIVSAFSLKTAELSDKNLRSAHLETVDNVNDLHAMRCTGPMAEERKSLRSKLHNTSWHANSDGSGVINQQRSFTV
jgi:hypothetical protein